MLSELALYSAPFITLAGFVIGLGAVTVIDVLGWLGRHSPYWTEATTRAHKVTKPLIWLGLLLVLIGSLLLFNSLNFPVSSYFYFGTLSILILNGSYLSCVVSPYLLSREHAGAADQPLPISWQHKIFVSFILSFVGWWSLFLYTVYLVTTYQ